MKDLNDYKAEIFRLSEKRIKDRRKRLRHVALTCVTVCLFLTVISTAALPRMISKDPTLVTVGSDEHTTDKETTDSAAETESIAPDCDVPEPEAPVEGTRIPEDAGGADGELSVPIGSTDYYGTLAGFSFSLTWGAYGVSSYDSVSGRLVKTLDATNPEDYITVYHLTDDDKEKIFALIDKLDITSYPDSYDPHCGALASDPSMTLVLSVKLGKTEKTVTAEDIALTYESDNKKGQDFLDVCREIKDLLTSTDEWKSLPDYEFLYD